MCIVTRVVPSGKWKLFREQNRFALTSCVFGNEGLQEFSTIGSGLIELIRVR